MGFEVIHPREMERMLKERCAMVIDVRSREAYRTYHFRSAVSCPYEEIERQCYRFPRQQVLILYCEYGSTSLLAARILAKACYEVYTVAGGIHAIRHYFHD